MNTVLYWKNRFQQQGSSYVANRHLKNYENQLELCKNFASPFLNNKFSHCLDFGCGVGRFFDFLKQFSSKITALDIFPEVLLSIKDKIDDISFWNIPELSYPVKYPYEKDEINLKLKCNSFNLKSDEFDLVWSIMTLQHIVHKTIFNKACQELKRVSKNKALFILIENFKDEAGHIIPRTDKEYLKMLNLNPIHIEKVDIDKKESHWFIVGEKNG